MGSLEQPDTLIRLGMVTAQRLTILMMAAASFLLSPANRPSLADERPVDFGRDVLPILSENCFACHGPDANQRQADLRLDNLEGATAGDAVKPGNSGESEAIRRIFSDDPAELMPPPKSKRTLSDAQKKLLQRWVDEGAHYAKHWAFIAPVRPVVPVAHASATINNPIDAFVVERLQRENLAQAPEAERAKLLRRVTLDLIGLPPTPQELKEFLADSSAGAYDRAVERLLSSRHYGERMVWEWLDAARYADTNGYQGDPTRPMWFWRDWAIDALNRNLPFDQFTIEQIAGDLLADPTRSQLIATGFHRNHMINGEGGRIAEESRVDYVQDRVETTGMVWMGLTLTCCRCHDHKYDPFTQKEYYQLAAYFNSIEETGSNDAGGLANPLLLMPTPDLQQRIDTLKIEEQAAEKERAEIEARARTEQSTWEQKFFGEDGKLRELPWEPLVPIECSSEQGTSLTTLEDGSTRASGTSPARDDYLITVPVGSVPFTGFKLETIPDESFPNQGPGRADDGNFVLTEFSLKIDGASIDLATIGADYTQQGSDPRTVFDNNHATGWSVAPEFGKTHSLTVAPRGPIVTKDAKQLVFRLSFRFGRAHTLGRFRLLATTAEPALVALPPTVRGALTKPEDQRSDAEKKEVADLFLAWHPQLTEATRKRDDRRRSREAAERRVPRTMVMRERAEPRDTFILIKGAYNAPSDKVEHGILTGLATLPAEAPKNRLALAQWLVSPEHPLMARVTVNRLWQQFFGNGLVKTSEDFGVQGDKPSHPELLDWLAVEFRESGWDVKHLVRLIVNSATYRQSSKVPPGMAERDPDNRLLARGPRFRLPSWMIRDQALAASGLLVEKSGGPPVKGYQPPNIWEDATFGKIRYEQEHGEALYRRSLYTFWRRIVAPTVFFDVANRQNCTVKSGRTNTPLHALVTLNDVTFIEAARALAQRTLLSANATDDAGRITEMYLRCTSRSPQPHELDRLIQRLATLRATYARDREAASKLLAVGESKPEERLAADELAAWTVLASLILNLDEVLTKE